MTTENAIVRWDEELARYAQQQASIERPAVGKISFRSGQMTYQNQPIPGNKLECIIISSAHEHALYANVVENRAFDPSKPESPICYALSATGENMVPHPQAAKKAAAECASCPYFAWGSAGPGKKGKACKEVRRMLVLPRSAVIGPDGKFGDPLQVRKSEAAVCSIPTTSVKNWANYTAQLSGQFRRPAWAMLTEISVVPDARTQFQVKFAPVAEIPTEFMQTIIERVTQSEAIVMAPYAIQSTAPPPAQPLQQRKY